MSSWLAQSIDISLSQKPDLPDPTPVSPAEKFPFLCSLSSETMPSCVRSLFAQNPSQSQHSPVFHAKLQLATPKERVTLFGSSPFPSFPQPYVLQPLLLGVFFPKGMLNLLFASCQRKYTLWYRLSLIQSNSR